jgi:hypothetical protein
VRTMPKISMPAYAEASTARRFVTTPP